MPLSDLPTEIVLDIADQLDDAGMNALAHTNSQIYLFLSKYLYRRDVTREVSRSMTWAVENGVEATVQRALDAGGHLDPIPESFHIALIESAGKGDVNIVAALLKHDGINPNFRDILGDTPLYRACRWGETPVMRQLLARDDIDLNTILNRKGRIKTTLLQSAVRPGNMEVVNLLLSKDGIDVNLYCDVSPVIMALQFQLMKMAESLLARDDLDLNVMDRDGNHLLLYSENLGLDKVKLILDRTNVDPNLAGSHGQTVLINACFSPKNDADLIEFLLDHEGIDVNRQDHNGMTAFGYAVLRQSYGYHHPKVINFLLDRDDIDFNHLDRHGQTPLFYAASNKEVSVTDRLLQKKGIDVNIRDIDGSTVLQCLFDRDSYPDDRSVDIVRLLLSHHADPNITDNNGVSALSKVMEIQRTWGANEYLERIESLLRAAGAR